MATLVETPASQTGSTPTQSNGSQEQELFRQSYSLRVPKNMDGVKEIFTKDGKFNESALVYVVRAGLKQIVNNRTRQKLLERDEKGAPAFKPIDGVFDATDLVHDEPQRQALSQRDKVAKRLLDSGVPQAVINTMLEKYDENVGIEDNTGNISVDTNEAAVVLQGSGDKAKLVMRTGRPADDEEEAA